jgi:hypothetical protein
MRLKTHDNMKTITWSGEEIHPQNFVCIIFTWCYFMQPSVQIVLLISVYFTATWSGIYRIYSWKNRPSISLTLKYLMRFEIHLTADVTFQGCYNFRQSYIILYVRYILKFREIPTSFFMILLLYTLYGRINFMRNDGTNVPFLYDVTPYKAANL